MLTGRGPGVTAMDEERRFCALFQIPEQFNGSGEGG